MIFGNKSLDIILLITITALFSQIAAMKSANSTKKFRNHTDLAKLLAAFHGYGDSFLKTSKDVVPVTHKDSLKKDWCRTEPLVQKVREEGCVSRSVMTSFCYGQCNSFYVPKVHEWRRRADLAGPTPADVAFTGCAQCRPKRTVWMTVALQCPAAGGVGVGVGVGVRVLRRRVQRVKHCRCMAAP